MEIYSNPVDPIPDYSTRHPTRFHVAFIESDPSVAKEKLANAGASLVEEASFDGGTHMIMLRDPWGIPIQPCMLSAPLMRS